jgi:UDP-N-acetylglucosamine 2-epimerase (non-hydrolysing)
MKVKPVLDALERRGAEAVLVHTGQHYDPAMSTVFFDELDLRPPDHYLGVGSGTQAETTARVMTAFEPLVERLQPDMVVVVGDVTSTMACALVAAKGGPLVAHVEAGLRSRDWSMPEEVNRVVTDRVSDVLLAPSPDAVDNLRAEGYGPEQIHLVGNVMVDTLLANRERAAKSDALARLGVQAGKYGLVTLHRPANVDDPATLAALVEVLGRVASKVLAQLSLPAGLRTTTPLGYLDFIALESGAALVLTDSGGVQEETTVLGVPCLTLRDNTERPITVSEGTNIVVGRDPERIMAGARRALEGQIQARRPALWDGHASERIADVLVTGPTRAH